jgi:hypothetical protein
MKRIVFFLSLIFLLNSCKQEAIQKPKNLIEQNKMVDIIYDLSLLEGIKTQNYGVKQNVNAMQFIYDKYKIDSLQFVKSNQYYASDIRNFKKIYEEVSKRIENNKAHLDSLENKKNKPNTSNSKPVEEEGIVK